MAGHATRFISVANIGSKGKGRVYFRFLIPQWFYAFNIVPLEKLGDADLSKLPAKIEPYPFVDPDTTAKKRKKEDIDESSFFWTEQQPGKPAAESRAIPPDTYVCHICNVPGHYIKDCPEKSSSARNQSKRPRGDTEKMACWFCLSNPDIESHLIVTLGEHWYVALAKGALCEDGHVIAVPVVHCAGLRLLDADARKESEKVGFALPIFSYPGD